jgi:hypothetical protein
MPESGAEAWGFQDDRSFSSLPASLLSESLRDYYRAAGSKPRAEGDGPRESVEPGLSVASRFPCDR